MPESGDLNFSLQNLQDFPHDVRLRGRAPSAKTWALTATKIGQVRTETCRVLPMEGGDAKLDGRHRSPTTANGRKKNQPHRHQSATSEWTPARHSPTAEKCLDPFTPAIESTSQDIPVGIKRQWSN